jgi:3,4-dihydroxy 2-butanone 4-phosphate synthase/GTP cyclohydrolase II
MSARAATPFAAHGTLLHLATHRLATVHGDFEIHVCENLASRSPTLVATLGDLRSDAPAPARVHSSCVTSESWGSCDCDCAEQLDAALGHIACAGRGAVFYLMQEGRGAGFVAKARDRMIVQASRGRLTTFDAYARMGLDRDQRRYEEVAFARALLGLRAPLRLLTNNPEKVAAVARAGVPLVDTEPLARAASPFNVDYLAAKSRSGHALETPGRAPRAVEPPEPVECLPPHAPAGAPRLVHAASYLLPVRLRDGAGPEGPHWFRLHAYVDLGARRERVVLTYGRVETGEPLVRVQRDALLERLPLRDRGAERRRWDATARAFVRHGAGCAVMVGGGCGERADAGGDAVAWLLAHHVPAGRARPVLDGPGESPADRALRAALARRGLETGAPLLLAAGGR